MEAVKSVKVGGYYWANLGRKNIPTYAGQKLVNIRERVQCVGIDGAEIIVKSVSDMRSEIIVKVPTVWRA
jgi:membrane protein implicated in regulation of membrane protease activity